MENQDLPIFSTVKEGLASGAPFRLEPGAFSINGLSDEQKLIVRDALMRDSKLQFTEIASEDELKMVGDILQIHKNLTSIRISFGCASAWGIEYIAERLKQAKVSEVWIHKSKTFDPSKVDLSKILEAVKYIDSLRHVCLFSNASLNEEESLASVFENSNLTKAIFRVADVPLPDRTWCILSQILSTHPSLTEFLLPNITPVGCACLGRALKTNSKLEALTIVKGAYEPISAADMTHLCEGLKMNTTLKTITMPILTEESNRIFVQSLANNGCKVTKACLGFEGGLSAAAALRDSLKTNTCLTLLDVRRFDPEKTQLLFQGLLHNQTLTKISFFISNIGTLGATAILNVLEKNASLRSLILTGCSLKTEHIEIIASGLKVNQTLTQLSLSQNSINRFGCRFISEAMKINRTLKYLDISADFPIGSKGIAVITDMIASNHTLRTLLIDRCYESPQEFDLLCEAMKINQGLTKLAASCFNNKGQFPRDRLEDLIHRNRRNHAEIKYNMTILSQNIARSKTNVQQLPREIWILILKSIPDELGMELNEFIERAFQLKYS